MFLYFLNQGSYSTASNPQLYTARESVCGPVCVCVHFCVFSGRGRWVWARVQMKEENHRRTWLKVNPKVYFGQWVHMLFSHSREPSEKRTTCPFGVRFFCPLVPQALMEMK
jgi:hypothetical protein